MRVLFVTFILIEALLRADLHEAVRICDPDTVAGLLANGASVRDTDLNGDTPLHVAVRAGRTECVQLLMKAGADPFALNLKRQSAWMLNGQYADAKIRSRMTLLLTGDKPVVRSKDDMPWSLPDAVRHGQYDVVALLLQLGSDPNYTAQDGNTLLHLAAWKGDVRMVNLLLDHGAEVSVRSRAGTFPLHDAAVAGNQEVVRALLAHGAVVDCLTDSSLDTPLHMAASLGKVEAIRALLAAGARPDLKNRKGRTAAQEAQAADQTEAVAALRIPAKH